MKHFSKNTIPFLTLVGQQNDPAWLDDHQSEPVFYNGDTGSYGRIDNIGGGRALVTETGPTPWGSIAQFQKAA